MNTQEIKNKAREKFDEVFPNSRSVFDGGDPFNARRNAIKSFIDTIIDLATKQAIEERDKAIIEMIDRHYHAYHYDNYRQGIYKEIKNLITNRDEK